MLAFEVLAKQLEKQNGRDSHEGVPILCFDPGHTTGWACFFGYDLIKTGEIDTSDMEIAPRAIKRLVDTHEPHTIVIEDYRVYKWRAKHHAGSELLTTQVIGSIKTFASLDLIPVVVQPAHVAKGFCDDKKLKAWDFHRRGSKHARDAIRHGCYYILFGKVKGKHKRGGTIVG